MAKNKDYSAEAIIARAQNAAYQDQKEMGKQIQENSKKQNVVTDTPVPTNPNLVLPTQKPVKLTENAPAPKPYMAMAVTKDGMPVYGSGLQGWARKAWADLTDPVKFFYDKKKLSQEQQDKVTSEFEAGKKQAGLVIEDKLKWSQWGEKIFGITAEELGIIAPLGKAERDIATQAGESVAGATVARVARIGLDTTQNVIWGGLAILGLGDQAVRKINSTMQGIDAVADKFNRDDTDNFVEKITVNNPISVGRDIYTIAKAIATGKTTWADTKETVSKYQAGSEMVYSMVFENNAHAEFEKGLAEGKDPVVLAQELGSIGIELAGSILGDPTTYLGLSLVKPVNIFSKTAREAGNLVKVGSFSTRLPWKTIARIPEFGEIIGATVGRARLANEAQRFLSVPPEIEKVFKGVTNSFGEIDAAKVSRETVKAIVARYSTKAVEPLSQMPIQKTTKFWNLSAYTAESKISVASKDASIWLQNMLAKVNGIDNAFLVLSDMKAIRKGGVEAEEAAARLLTHGSMVFSPVGEMVGEVLTRLDDDKIYDVIKKYGDNKVNLHNELFKKLGGIIDDFIPSVEEMSKAVDKVKEAKLAGLVPDERTLKLAEMYDDVPAIVKTVNKITKVPLAVAGKTSSAMVTLFMQFVPRSWSRNIQGAFLPMAARIGLFNALDISISAFRGLSKEGPLGIKALGTTDLLKRVDDDIFKMLDFVPMEDGIGKMVGTNKGIFKIGMLDAIKRSENIMGRRIIAQSVRDSISNALPAVVKNLPQWENFVSALPKEQQALPFAALQRAYGNPDEAEKILRGWIGKGEIEVWKLIEPPQALKKYLEDNGLAEAFATARDNAKSSDEFAASVQGWVSDYKKTIENAFKNQPVTSTAFAEHGDFGLDLAKQVPEKQRETIAALYQSWHETQKSLTNAYKTVLASADQMIARIPADIVNGVQDQTKRVEATNQLAQLKNMMDDTAEMTEAAWQRVDNIRTEFVKDIKSAKTPEEFKAMFNKVYQAGTFKFSLKDIYPTATEVTPDFVKSSGWSAFFEFASETHKGANSSRYGQVMNGLEEVAKMFGSTIDDMAGGNKAGDNVFNVLQTHYADALKFEQQHAMERFFRAWDFSKEKQMANTINLKEAAAKFKTQFPTWEGNIDSFIAQVDAKDSEKTKIAKLAGKWGIPSATKDGAPLDKKLLNIVNSYAMKLAGDVDTTVGKTTKTKDAFKYLSKHGGISPSDFAEAFGDTIGKQRMIPGLVQNNAGDIDRVGIRLWEGGFISRQEADDANFVRDFLRNFKPTQVDDEARLAAKEAADFKGFRSLDEVPSGIADEAFRLHAEEKGLKPTLKVTGQPALFGETTLTERLNSMSNLSLPEAAKLNEDIGLVLKNGGVPDEVIKQLETERMYKIALEKAKQSKKLRSTSADASRMLESATSNYKGQGYQTTAILKKNNLTRDEIRTLITGTETRVVDKTQPYYDEVGNLVEPLAPEIKKELTMADAIEAFKATRLAPPETGLLPTEAEVLARGLKNFEGDVKRWTDAVVKEWGVKTKTIPPEQMPDFKNLWNEAKAAIKPRMDHVKLEAGVTGVSTRNFVLHDYNKTYADHALSMMLGNSFHYWTTRTYSRALETLVENPKYANMYMRYKEYNTKRHSDQPEWYRQNIQFDNVMGIPLKNPYFVNLEAAINPMYGLTGTDFNDPKKRVDWVSRTVDDMNKMGPSFSPLISWAIGMNMFRKGEQEAGQRWMGRLLPPSVLVKSASSALLGKPIEIDPFVNFLDGGVDPYERNRVAAALANMVRTGEITSEEMIEASRMKSGPIWEAGIEASATARFGSDATSFFLGAGLRPRTEDDMKIEKFWQDYGAMIASSSMMSSDQYRQQWDKMRDNPDYGMFMDALLLSRKSGDDMDTAYVYNVLSRIPPGQLNDISEIAGIRPDLLQSFYDNKGDFDRMGIPPQDRQILIGQVVNIGAILAMPDTATRQDWSAAKTQYKQMQDMLAETFGENINELMSEYYSVPNQADWLEANPDVDAAMKLKDQIVMSNPQLMQYYGGIQVVERYYTTAMENDLMKKYGEDIKDQETEYYDLLSDAEQKAYKASHPNLKPYWKEKTAYKAEMQKKLDAMAKNLPDKPLPQQRPNVTPENVPQEQLQNMAPIPFSQWQQELGTPITSLIEEYANGADLPRQVRSALDYEAYKYGFYDGDAMLQAILQSLPQ